VAPTIWITALQFTSALKLDAVITYFKSLVITYTAAWLNRNPSSRETHHKNSPPKNENIFIYLP
jgi:hypothetical protein